MKKIMIIGFIVVFMTTLSYAGGVNKIGNVVVKSGFTGNMHIEITTFSDPENPFVTLALTHVVDKRFGSTADPSNNCIAARLTEKIGKRKVYTRENNDILKIKKSWLSKTLRISRHYDKTNDMLIYVVFSRKGWRDGSPKHSMSVVPLAAGR